MKISLKYKYLFKISSISFLLFSFFILQLNQDNIVFSQNVCTVTDVGFSPYGAQQTGWFTNGPPPEVNVTINTTGNCDNKTIKLEIQDYRTVGTPEQVLISSDYTFKSGENSHIFKYKSGDMCTVDSDQFPLHCAVFAKTEEKPILGVGPLPSMNFSSENQQLTSSSRLTYEKGLGSIPWTLITPPAPPATGGDPVSGDSGTTDDSLPKLQNPLCAEGSTKCIESIPDFIKVALDVIVLIAVPAVALAIMYAGFLMIFGAATGNAAKIKEGREAFLYAVIGGAILLGAWVIATAIGDTVNSLGN